MSEIDDVQAFAAAGSGKSPEEVAFDLVNKLKGQGVWGERNMSAILDMYAECLDATKGLRPYSGQNRVESPVAKPTLEMIEAQKKAQAQANAALQTATPGSVPFNAGQPAAVQPQSVPAQQQALNQAFKQT